MGPCFALLLGCWADKSRDVRLISLCSATVGCWAQHCSGGRKNRSLKEAEAGIPAAVTAGNHTEELGTKSQRSTGLP